MSPGAPSCSSEAKFNGHCSAMARNLISPGSCRKWGILHLQSPGIFLLSHDYVKSIYHIKMEKIEEKRKSISCNYFSSLLNFRKKKKKVYALDRRVGCLLSTLLSPCSPSPRITYKITFKRSIFFAIGFMDLEQLLYFKHLLAIVCEAIADNPWRVL